MNRVSLVPILLWLAGFGAYTVVGVESLFAGQELVFAVARLTAYITAATVAAMALGFAAVFGIACGAMLVWLGERPSPRSVATAVGRAFWAVAVYVWLGVGLLAGRPAGGAVGVGDRGAGGARSAD